MSNSLHYYVSSRGENGVQDFIKSLTIREQAKVFAYFQELLRQGHNLRRPMADYIGNGIYELRPKNNRIFYFFFIDSKIVFLHAIRKKTDMIPQRDLEICIKRRNEVEELNNIDSVQL